MFDPVRVKEEIVRWVWNYFEKNGKDCNAVVGISGGKDSSVVAAICAAALGKDKVYGVLMPQGEQHDIAYSREIVELLGIKSFTVNIKDSVDTLTASIKTSSIELNKQAITNIPARIRMTTLYAVASTVNGRVANTCNLSEDWVGYSTKYGDAAGDFSPMSQLTATEVRSVGLELGLPAKFVEKVPEDGLSGLTDEENLGFTYDLLDKYIRFGLCDNNEIKEKIDRLHIANMHKLKLMPCFYP